MDVNDILPSDNMCTADIVMLNVRQNPFLYVYWDICSHALAQTCWTRNKSDYWVHGVMFNNKMYYLPRSMCVAFAIKCNERKALEGRSKFWCVVILSTLWQHTARQGCKTSSNRLLNIRLLHSYTPPRPYVKSGPHAKVCEPAKCVKDCMWQHEDTLQGTGVRVEKKREMGGRLRFFVKLVTFNQMIEMCWQHQR